jgi:hypothetical protein
VSARKCTLRVLRAWLIDCYTSPTQSIQQPRITRFPLLPNPPPPPYTPSNPWLYWPTTPLRLQRYSPSHSRALASRATLYYLSAWAHRGVTVFWWCLYAHWRGSDGPTMGAEVSLSVGVVARKPKNENQLNNRLGMQNCVGLPGFCTLFNR